MRRRAAPGACARASAFRGRPCANGGGAIRRRGPEGLSDTSRRPASSPNQKVFAREEALILELRQSEGLGVHRLKAELSRRHGLDLSPETILKTLKRAGEPMKTRAEPAPARERPSEARQFGRGGLFHGLASDDSRRQRHRLVHRRRALQARAEAERDPYRREARDRPHAGARGVAASGLRRHRHPASQPRRLRRRSLARRGAAGLCGAAADRGRDRRRPLPPLHRARHPRAARRMSSASRGRAIPAIAGDMCIC